MRRGKGGGAVWQTATSPTPQAQASRHRREITRGQAKYPGTSILFLFSCHFLTGPGAFQKKSTERASDTYTGAEEGRCGEQGTGKQKTSGYFIPFAPTLTSPLIFVDEEGNLIHTQHQTHKRLHVKDIHKCT